MGWCSRGGDHAHKFWESGDRARRGGSPRGEAPRVLHGSSGQHEGAYNSLPPRNDLDWVGSFSLLVILCCWLLSPRGLLGAGFLSELSFALSRRSWCNPAPRLTPGTLADTNTSTTHDHRLNLIPALSSQIPTADDIMPDRARSNAETGADPSPYEQSSRRSTSSSRVTPHGRGGAGTSCPILAP